MNVLFCVQRYGEDVPGGAEVACRRFAEGIASRRHRVEVLTSCARDYVSWSDEYPPGTSELHGVQVHRLRVRAPRTEEQFGTLSARVLGRQVPLAVQRDWVRVQGPDLADQRRWLSEHARRFDVAVFYTYLYPTTAIGLPEASRHTATVLHPAAHVEPTYALDVFDDLFAHSDGVSAQTPEEAALVLQRHPRARVELVGNGVDLGPGGHGARFRERYEIGDRPLLVYVGRVDRNKGADELARYVAHLRTRMPDLRLAMVGEVVHDVDRDAGTVLTGFVDDQTKYDAYAAANVFVLPSYFESFSIALSEAWLHRRPALVQGHCDVLRGQVLRSGGGIPYRGLAEFEVALNRLLADPGLRETMGDMGYRYTMAHNTWPQVLDRYERFLTSVVTERQRRDAALSTRLGLDRRLASTGGLR